MESLKLPYDLYASSPFNLLNFDFIYGLIITLVIDNVLLNWLHCRTSKTLERYQRCCYTSQDSNVSNREAQVCVLWHFGFHHVEYFVTIFILLYYFDDILHQELFWQCERITLPTLIISCPKVEYIYEFACPSKLDNRIPTHKSGIN